MYQLSSYILKEIDLIKKIYDFVNYFSFRKDIPILSLIGDVFVEAES